MELRSLEDLGADYLRLKSQKESIEFQMEAIKGQVHKHMYQEGKGHIVVPMDEKFEIVFQNNVRFTKSFDKDGLSAKARVDRDDLDYEGVANLIEQKKLTPKVVGEFQSENKSEFVTIRRRGRTD